MGNDEYKLLQFTGTNNKSLIKHKCGFVFSRRISELGRGCPKCYSKMSLLEQKVNQFLIYNKYNFIYQKRYEDLKRFSFDFCVLINNKEILIEVQGQQHYYTVNDAYLGTIEHQKERDNIKKEYCLANNIPLIEVPYWEIDNLDIFLKPKLNDYLEKE
jgi:very-short-patch-repair endonuclease